MVSEYLVEGVWYTCHQTWDGKTLKTYLNDKEINNETMKTEDLERLKQICYKEGFKVESLNHADTYVIKPERKIHEVSYLGWEHGYQKGFQFNFDFKDPGCDMNHIGNHLAECLKEYLTKKQNA